MSDQSFRGQIDTLREKLQKGERGGSDQDREYLLQMWDNHSYSDEQEKRVTTA